jgi:hypothetical protein
MRLCVVAQIAPLVTTPMPTVDVDRDALVVEQEVPTLRQVIGARLATFTENAGAVGRGTEVAPADSSRVVANSARATAFAIAVIATCGCMVFAAGCGRSPTAPDGGGTHIRLRVTDRALRPVAGALLTIMSGPLAGTTKRADDAGRIELTGGGAGQVTLRVGRDDYETRTAALAWDSPTSGYRYYVPFWLETLEPPIGLDPGEYTLTLAIDVATARSFNTKAPCAGFPVEFASRSYRATIAEVSSPFWPYNRRVSSDHPTLLSHDLLSFAIAGRFVGFESDDPWLTEEFPEFRHLKIGGSARTSEPAIATGSSVSILFQGDFTFCQTRSFPSRDCWHERAEEIVDYRACFSDHATMVFAKR